MEIGRGALPFGFMIRSLTEARLALVLIGPALLAAADSASVTLQVSSETAPAGGWTQIKLFATSSVNISSATMAQSALA